MTPKSMSSEVENIEIKAKKITRTNSNLSGQTARQPISHEFLTIYKHPDKRAGQIQFGNYSAPPMGMSNRLTVVLQQELH